MSVDERREGAFEQRVERFSVGSVRVTALQVEASDNPSRDLEQVLGLSAASDASADPVVSPYGISGRTVTSGSGFTTRTNCLVAGSSGQVSFYFFATYTLVQGGYDYITSTIDPGQSCAWPTSCQMPYRSAFTSRESSTTTAGATYTGHISHPFGTQTGYLSLVVGRDRASAVMTIPYGGLHV